MKLNVVSIPATGVPLAGLHYEPENRPHRTGLLFAHGFTSAKHSMDLLACYLAGRGYPCLAFDFVGHKLGGTGGAMTHIGQTVENVRDAANYLQRMEGVDRVVLVGHSMGAAASLAFAGNKLEARARTVEAESGDVEIAGLVSICMGLEPTRGFTDAIGRAMVTQRADYVAGAPAIQLLMEMEGLLKSAPHLAGLPSLFVAARQDVLIPPVRIEALASLAGSSAKFEIIEATHLDAPERARGPIAAWLAGAFQS